MKKKLKILIIFALTVKTAAFGMPLDSVINSLDTNNLKQGKWVYYFDTLHTTIACEGNYTNDKRQGIWTEYYRNGNKKSMITYVNGVPFGYVRLFYENGNPWEEGNWNRYGWVGEYRSFHKNGKIAKELNYDENTLRCGQQKYYSENGKMIMSGNWENGFAQGLVAEYYDNGKLRSESQFKHGNINGIVKEYYESGALKAEIVYNNGFYDIAASKTYRENHKKEHIAAVKEEPPQETPEKREPDVYATFTGTGYHKIYTLDKKLEREGDFVKGVLQKGKRYYYNSKGDLIKVAIYENGRIIKIEEK